MRKAGEILESLFEDRFGQQFAERVRSTAGLFSAWEHIVTEAWHFRKDSRLDEGDDMPQAASHSRVRELEKGALLIEADHPGWVQILQTKQRELLSIVRRRFSELDIRSISFCLSREPFSFSERKPETLVLEAVAAEESLPKKRKTKKAAAGNDYYYEALKRFETSVKERNDQL